MDFDKNILFGQVITKLINKKNLTIAESYDAFCMVLNNEVSEMQQGAFLSALTAKGETADEVAGGWQAVFELDTAKVTLNCSDEIVDNCGTGMDTFKTFNISTAASVVAAGGGIKVARHGARAISSICGTVDMAECLGVDVDCTVGVVARSIEEAGIGLFNGMSPQVHPMALGRILSQIRFGSPLNIAASLANPALPKIAVRGVYSKELVRPVIKVMQSIGYTDALVIFGTIDGSDQGMDEASVCGTTHAARLQHDTITEFTIEPEACGLARHLPEALGPEPDLIKAGQKMVGLLDGQVNGAQQDAVVLNSALIFYIKGMVSSLRNGVEMAREVLVSGKAMASLEKWVELQNTDPAAGIEKLNALRRGIQL